MCSIVTIEMPRLKNIDHGEFYVYVPIRKSLMSKKANWCKLTKKLILHYAKQAVTLYLGKSEYIHMLEMKQASIHIMVANTVSYPLIRCYFHS